MTAKPTRTTAGNDNGTPPGGDPATPHVRWQRVTDARAARLLLDPTGRRVMEPFLLGEHSVKGAADALGLPLGVVHHRVKRFEATGLVCVTRAEARRGRPVRYYRAAADGFLIPLGATPDLSLESVIGRQEAQEQARFEAQLIRAGLPLVERLEDVGFRMYRTSRGVWCDVTPRAEHFDFFRDFLAPSAPALWTTWNTVHLTHEDAKALQQELAALMHRYTNRAGPQAYTLRLGLAPEAP